MLTAWEVVKYSPAGRDYPTDYICNVLCTKVKEYFKCIGLDIYYFMLNDIEAKPSYVDYDPNLTYNLL